VSVKTASVGVVIVNANAGAHLAHTLETVLAQTAQPARVVVVDNASTDGSLDGLEDRFPSVEFVRSPENLGFAAGNNLAVAALDDCEFVALLNPDAFPAPDWLETLLEAAASHPEHAVFGSRLVLDGDPNVLDGSGDVVHVSGLAWRRDQGAPATVDRPSGETFSACAAAALYRRAAFVEVGGFDESFFCYYEDTDLAFRLRLAGHGCLYVPEAVARHVGSATTGLLSDFTIYHSARNQLWAYLKNMPSLLFWLYLPQHLLVTALTVLAYATQGRGRAALRGKRDALRDLRRVLAERRRIQRNRKVGVWALRRAMAHGVAGFVVVFFNRRREWRRHGGVAPADALPSRPALDHVDGLRALAALFVVFHHAWLTVWPNVLQTHLPAVGSAARPLAYGHFAVTVFIVVSGFCLGLPVARNRRLSGGALGFLRRRARRILPPYYAAVGLSLLLIWTLIGTRTGTHWDISVPVDGRGYAGAAFLVDNVLGGGQVNHVLWSVALESQIYLVFPLLVLCWLRFGVGWAGAAAGALAAALAGLVAVVPTLGPFQLSGLTPWFLALFALGMVGAAIAEAPSTRLRTLFARGPWRALAVLSALAVVVVCTVLGRQRAFAHIAALDFVVGAATVSLILAAARSPQGLAQRLLSARPLLLLGGFSYSLYLIHAPLLQVEWEYFFQPYGLDPSQTFLGLVLVGVPLTVGAAYLFFLAVERPFLSAAHRARLRRPAAPERAGTPAPMPLPVAQGEPL
jgi:GT2 family glycosyltransferase/peptidoglycan/LPS O-acetylase OafA/YrhL